ncbi:DUF3298 domain-containing protein, partial [Mycobacterium sp. ITM-2017-0098]
MRTLVAALTAAGVSVCLAAAPAVVAQPAAAPAPSACVDLSGTVDADKICRVHTETPSYRLDYTLPVDYPDQPALTAYLTQTRDGFVNVAGMPGSWNLPYVLDAKGTGYRTGLDDGGTRSV